MSTMILHAFTGDHQGNCWRNRQPNEILFTAQRPDGGTINAIVPGAMSVQLLDPGPRTLPVTNVIRDGYAFRAQLARFDDEPPVHSGLYLASVFVVVFVAGSGEFDGIGLASVRIDEDLPTVNRPSEEQNAAKAARGPGDIFN